jgi:hypothetical protein
MAAELMGIMVRTPQHSMCGYFLIQAPSTPLIEINFGSSAMRH